MMVIHELSGTYWGADFACRLFEKAEQDVSEDALEGSRWSRVEHSLAGPLTPNSRLAVFPCRARGGLRERLVSARFLSV